MFGFYRNKELYITCSVSLVNFVSEVLLWSYEANVDDSFQFITLALTCFIIRFMVGLINKEGQTNMVKLLSLKAF